MFELRSVRKTHGALVAVDGLSLILARSSTTVLIGPSGSGKSTILKLMAGQLAPDSGEVLFDGAPLARPVPALSRARMGHVVQDGALFPHLSAKDNVALVPRRLGWDRARLERRIDDLAAVARLPEDALQRYPLELSGGQRQRVALMRALVLDPDVLLLDEPLGALDPMVRAQLQEDLRDAFGGVGKTVVLVTHDLAEAAFFGAVIVLLRDGRIVQSGTFQDLVLRPADPFVTEFVRAQRGIPA